MVKNGLKLGLFVGILVLLMIVERMQRSMFKNASIEQISRIQQNDTPATVAFFKFIYNIGDTRCYFIFVMLLFNFVSRQTSFYFAFVLCANVFTETFMKLAFQDGRPFMQTSKIFPFVCELEFGNPAVEAMNCVAFAFALGFFAYERLKEQDEELSDKQKVSIALGILMSLIMIILFCLQGIYNGTNSIDQVLFGVELGLFIATFSHFFVREALEKHVTNVMDGLYVNRYRQAVLGVLVAFLCAFVVVTLYYALAVSRFKAPGSWLYQISVKCPVSQQITELIFQDAVYVEYGLMFYLAGAYFGLIVDAKYFRGTIRSVNDTSVRKKMTRVVLSALPIVPIFVCPVFLIASRRFIFAVLAVKYGLPAFMIGFLLFGYSKPVYERFNLTNEYDSTLTLESSMNMGRLEEVEEEKEFTGKKRDKMYEEGLQEQSTY